MHFMCCRNRITATCNGRHNVNRREGFDTSSITVHIILPPYPRIEGLSGWVRGTGGEARVGCIKMQRTAYENDSQQ